LQRAALSLLVLVLCGPRAGAAPVALAAGGPLADRFAVDGWSTREGLPQASVTDLTQGPLGSLHATTFGGAARFDGVRFGVLDPTRHPLPSIRFTAVEAADDGRVWYGTQYGDVVVRLGDTLERLPPTGTRAVVRRLLSVGEDLWAAVGPELLRLDGDRWARIPRQVNAMAPDGDGLWLAGDGGLARLEAGAVTAVALPFGGRLGAVQPDGSGNVWVAGEEGIAVRPAGEPAFLQVRRTRTRDEAPLSADLAVDGAGRVWLSHMEGLELIGVADALIPAARAGEPLDSVARWEIPGVRRLRLDREGHLWVGTDTRGLLRLTPLPYERIASPSPAQASVRVVERDGDRMLVAPTCAGVWAVRPGEAPVQVLPDQCVHALRATSRGVLVGSGDAVIALDQPEQVLARVGADVLALAEDRDGSVLVGSHGDGAFRLRDGALARLDAIPADGAVHTLVRGLDAWWFGLEDRLIVLREGGRAAVLTPEHGLPRGDVRAILLEGEGPGAVAWVGTYGGGLARLTGLSGLWAEGGPQVVVERLSERDGFPDNTVSALVADDRGMLWGNGNRGVFGVRRAALQASLRGEVLPLARRLPSSEGNGGASPAHAVDAAGHLWFPTIDGLVRLDPAALRANDVAPDPVIEQVVVDGHAFDVGGGWAAPPGRRDTLIRFTAAVLGYPELARFQYRLVPLQPEWQDAGQREVRFASLPPGRYRFEVRAANEDGVWSAAPARASIVLNPRVSETTGFRVVAALVLASLVVSVVQWLRARNGALQVEIDGRTRIEGALREREAHYRLVFEAASDGLLVTDADGLVREANSAAAAMLTAPAGDGAPRLVGRAATSLFEGERGLRLDGTSFPARISRAKLGDGRSLWSIADLTVRVELDERLAQSRRLEDVGRLAGGIAHEFNNLLAVAKANAASMRAALDGDVDRDALLESIGLVESASARGANLTSQLLAYGQRQLLRPQHVDLAELVRRAEPMLRRVAARGARLRVRAGEAVVVLVDPGQTELALANLVMIAARAGGERARPVEITVTRVGGGEAAARWADASPAPHGEYGVLSVTSDRPVAAHGEEGLFEPFTGDGGLGLAAVHGFVAQSQGSVHARPGPDGGTVFEVVLPAVSVEPTPAPAAASPPPPARPARILVCDDDPMVRRTVERLLSSSGFTVWSANGGAQALEILQEVPIDLLLTDVLMPGMSGTELAAEARAVVPELRVVFVSGYTKQVDSDIFTDLLVEKPFETGALLAAVRKALG
jgi:signal transduction histidine kinase/CheY-like chemotaxis protein/ligand-binding sensor domain-containing protein